MPTKKAIIASMSKRELQTTLAKHSIAYRKSSNKTVLQEIVNKQLKKSQLFLLGMTGGAIQHCDIKPENIMLCADANGVLQAKLIDFGLANLKSNKSCTGGTLPFVPSPIFFLQEIDEDNLKIDSKREIGRFIGDMDILINTYIPKCTKSSNTYIHIIFEFIPVFYGSLARMYKAISNKDIVFPSYNAQSNWRNVLIEWLESTWKDIDTNFVDGLYERLIEIENNNLLANDFATKLQILELVADTAQNIDMTDIHKQYYDFYDIIQKIQQRHIVKSLVVNNATKSSLKSDLDTAISKLNNVIGYALTYDTVQSDIFNDQDIYASDLTLCIMKASMFANLITGGNNHLMHYNTEGFPKAKQSIDQIAQNNLKSDIQSNLGKIPNNKKILGQGGFGKVFESLDTKNAVKVVFSQDLEKAKLKQIVPQINSLRGKHTLLKDMSYYTDLNDPNIVFTKCIGKDLNSILREGLVTKEIYESVETMLNEMCTLFKTINIENPK